MQKSELGHIAVVTQRCCFRLLLLFCRLIRSDSFMTLWTVAHQAPLSMGFPMEEDWSGLSFSSPGYLPHPGLEPASPALQADSVLLSHQGSPAISDWPREGHPDPLFRPRSEFWQGAGPVHAHLPARHV